jgi:hypothetical protein
MQTYTENLRLFKYFPPQRVDVLENEKIAFTPPDRFKDPFEFRVGISRATLRNQIKEVIEEAEINSENYSRAYKELSRRQRLKMRKSVFRKAKISEQFRETFSKTIQTQSCQLGILCLCEVNDSNLMWYHYADGHKGFVMEFDIHHEAFRNLGAVWKVEYFAAPPVYDHTKPTPEIFRFKPNYLKYEAEWRMIRQLSEFVPEKNGEGSPLYFHKLPRDCVKAIYVGHRMEKKVSDKISGLLKGGKTQTFEAVPSQKDYAFTFRQK